MNNTALLVIDVQQGMFGDEGFFEQERLLTNVGTLLEKARAAGVPVVYVQHAAGSIEDPLHPDLPGHAIHAQITPQEGEPVVVKRQADAFADTNLKTVLKGIGAERLVVCGLQTDECVNATTRRAHALGYDVTLVADAHGTWDTDQQTATEIVTEHNHALGALGAKVKPMAEINFTAAA